MPSPRVPPEVFRLLCPRTKYWTRDRLEIEVDRAYKKGEALLLRVTVGL